MQKLMWGFLCATAAAENPCHSRPASWAELHEHANSVGRNGWLATVSETEGYTETRDG